MSYSEATVSCSEKPASYWEATASSCAVAGSGAPLRLFASTFEPQRLLELRPARCRIDSAPKCRILTYVSKRGLQLTQNGGWEHPPQRERT